MSKHRRITRISLLLSLSLVYGCGNVDPVSGTGTAASFVWFDFSPYKLLSATELDQLKASGLVEANNRFGQDLFMQIYREAPGQNHFFSTVSVALALQMALQGADEETLTQIRKSLRLEGLDNQVLLATMPLLLRKLHRPTHDVSLEIANSLWLNRKFRFKSDFLTSVQQPFEAKLENLDADSSSAVRRINAWASDATHGKISNVLGSLDSDATVAMLLNAIYFKGTWTFQFDKEDTAPGDFRLESGQNKQVQMMRQFGKFLYHPPRGDFPHQGIRLPYGQEGKLAMYVFLPSFGKTLADLQRDFENQGFDAVHKQFIRDEGDFRMPRFSLKQQRSLVPNLSRLGMPLAFDQQQANFKRLAEFDPIKENIYLSKVEQHAYVDINEEGTEAAAVTTVTSFISVPSSAPSRISMVVDHPFLFLIRDDDSGQILFMGSITDPPL